MHLLIGQLGHFFVILCFVAALLASISFFISQQSSFDLAKSQSWQRLGRWAFYVHVMSTLAIVASLFFIIYNHYFEYHYAWSHSSRQLPVYYMISCFWEGQEGSFLLWIFWQAIIGVVLIRVNRSWLSALMSIFAMVQAFLGSMILGSMVGVLKIGSSPFILMREAMAQAPIFISNPDYVPLDGRGLNPLLQNYWMVIHPPTLFLGFALTLVPFAYCLAGLWQKRYSEWVRPAFPWALLASLVLGVGILMGAYWAYETLNFGGYWNWDPVENAVYVPWVVLIAGVHGLIIYRKNGTALRLSILLVIASFLLVLYATFLTRSGILGNSSVHSFTDLGLSGQLLIYLLTFVIGAVSLLAWRWKHLPTEGSEVSAYSREFWIFLGIITLSLASFQVLAATSIPVFNAVLKLFGAEANFAPPSDAVAYYSAWQMWFGMVVAALSGLAQYMWWKQSEARPLWNYMQPALIISPLITMLIVIFAKMSRPDYILLILSCVYCFVANLQIGIGIIKKGTIRHTGGSLAHVGLALMLLGILFSSGYSETISKNNSGMVYRKEFTQEMNSDNVLLWRGKANQMGEYELEYKGDCKEVKGFPTLVKKEFLGPAALPYQAVARTELVYNNKVYFKKGDTVETNAENTYYAIQYRRANKDTFMLYPRAQLNPSMGLLASPDIKNFFLYDLYTHVSSVPPMDQEPEYGPDEKHEVSINDTFIVNDYVAQLVSALRVEQVEGVEMKPGDIAVKAQIRIFGQNENYIAEPVFVIQNNQIGKIAGSCQALGLRFTIANIDPKASKFTIVSNSAQRQWIILKAVRKPFINLLWLGALLIVGGFGFALQRRYREFRLMRNKAME